MLNRSPLSKHAASGEIPVARGEHLAPNTLVLLPGMDGTGKLFVDFVSALPDTLRSRIAIYPTQRYLSYTELLPYVTAVIPGDEGFVLVAESFSSPLAVMLAATHPPNLAGMVLCAGFVTSPIRSSQVLIELLARPLWFHIPASDFILEHFLLGTDPAPALKLAVRHAVNSVSPGVLARRLRAVLECDARRDLARVDVPLLYIQATRDRLVRAQCFREVQRLKPGVVLASIAAPHLVLQREPQAAAQIIVEFVGRLAGTR